MRHRLKCPHWLYRWIDRRGHIPWLVRKLWPTSHWCPEMDDLLIIENASDCFCGHCFNYWEEFSKAVNAAQAKYDADHNNPPPF